MLQSPGCLSATYSPAVQLIVVFSRNPVCVPLQSWQQSDNKLLPDTTVAAPITIAGDANAAAFATSDVPPSLEAERYRVIILPAL